MEPLIFTKHGNLPISQLKHDVEWRVTPEQIIFIERYWLADEVVKESSHVHILTGAEAPGIASL